MVQAWLLVRAGLTLVVFSGTEAKPELQVVGRRPASVRGAVGGVKRGEVCRQELVLRVGGKREHKYRASHGHIQTDWTQTRHTPVVQLLASPHFFRQWLAARLASTRVYLNVRAPPHLLADRITNHTQTHATRIAMFSPAKLWMQTHATWLHIVLLFCARRHRLFKVSRLG
eukprot:COSAG01_NODE_6819_length_3483_cov_24.232565_5_plen_171_part_00